MVADGDNDKAKTVKLLMALAEEGNAQRMQEALNDWYSADKKDYRNFVEKYSLGEALKHQGNKLNLMKRWCDDMSITFTPTIFFDGYQLPSVYAIQDIKHLI